MGRRRRRNLLRKPEGPPLPAWLTAALVLVSMLSSTLLIPTVRPFFAAFHPGQEGALHAFMSVNMLGAVLGAPLIALLADKTGKRGLALVVCAGLDGAFLGVCALPLPLEVVLVVRALQGAMNVGALSLLMSLAARVPGGLGLAGAATVFAIALGAPLGTALLSFGPAAALQVGAACAFVVAAVVGALQPGWTRAAQPSAWQVLSSQRTMLVPAGLVFVERFAIGCFVVPFSLYAHQALQLSDRSTGMLFTAFLFPFALGTALLARRAVPPAAVVACLVLYGALLGALSSTPVALLAPALVGAGVAASAVYAASLGLVTRLAQPEARAVAMSVVNAAGSLGMLLGSAGAGVLVTRLKAQGAGPDAYGAAFWIAGAVCLVAAVVLHRPLHIVARGVDGDADVSPAPSR